MGRELLQRRPAQRSGKRFRHRSSWGQRVQPVQSREPAPHVLDELAQVVLDLGVALGELVPLLLGLLQLLQQVEDHFDARDRKSTRLNSSHVAISYAVFCLKK